MPELSPVARWVLCRRDAGELDRAHALARRLLAEHPDSEHAVAARELLGG